MKISEHLLPTPTAMDARGHMESTQQKEGSKHSVSLRNAVNMSSTYSRAGSLASLFPKPDEDEERKTIGISGRRCYESYENFIPDGLLRRMSRGLLHGTKAWFSTRCSLIWKAKVILRKHILFQLAPSTPRTDEIESGLLATPNTMDLMEPKTEKAIMRESMVTRKGRTNFANLKEQVAYGKMLPTPQASESQRGPSKLNERGRKQNKNGTEWTPRMQDMLFHRTGLKLQPAFVEWMMGFPEGWTEIPDSKLLEMQSFRKSQRKS